jgi:hypothetical protein
MKQIRKRLTYANVMSTIAVFAALGGATAFAATNLPANSVGTPQLKKEAVAPGKIRNGAVIAAKLGAGAVTPQSIAKAAVTANALANGSVTAAALANNAVDPNALQKNAVTAEKIAANAVITEKIANNAVSTPKIANEGVTEGKIANDAVSGAKVKNNSLTGTDINQGTLNSVKAANVFATEFNVGPNTLVNPSDPGIKSGGCFIACLVEFPRNVSNCTASGSSVRTNGGETLELAAIETFPSGNANAVLVVALGKEGTIIGHDFALTVVCPTTS